MRKIVILVMIVQMAIFLSTFSFAASDKCVVKETKGKTVVLECRKSSDNFKVNDRVKVKSTRSNQIEGC